MNRGAEFAALSDDVHSHLDAVHAAREVALTACRKTIRACGSSIRAVHRHDSEQAEQLASQAAESLALAQQALRPFPTLAASGPLHDAEKEYAEARLTAALVSNQPLPHAAALGVAVPSWLGGLAEAASELRRNLLDRLRGGDLDAAESLLASMDDVYGLLTGIDYPDAVTGGLRRQVDALRAVLERSRGDLTITLVQHRLQATIESHVPPVG